MAYWKLLPDYFKEDLEKCQESFDKWEWLKTNKRSLRRQFSSKNFNFSATKRKVEQEKMQVE